MPRSKQIKKTLIKYLPYILFVVFAVVFWMMRSGILIWEDSARYVMGAQSLIKDGTYTLQMWERMSIPQYFPMGLSLLMVPVLAIPGAEPHHAALISALAGAGVMTLLYVWSREWFKKPSDQRTLYLIWAVLLLALPTFHIFVREVTSEIPSLLVILLCIWSYEHLYSSPRWRSWWVFVLIGALTAAAIMLRYANVVLVPVLLTALLLSPLRAQVRNKPLHVVGILALITLGGTLILLPQLIYNTVHFGAPWHVAVQTDTYFTVTAGAIGRGLVEILLPLLKQPVVLIGIAGYYLLYKKYPRRISLWVVYSVLAILLYSAWWAHDPRYLLPIVTLTLLSVGALIMYGMQQHATTRAQQRMRLIIPTVLAAVLLSVSSTWNMYAYISEGENIFEEIAYYLEAKVRHDALLFTAAKGEYRIYGEVVLFVNLYSTHSLRELETVTEAEVDEALQSGRPVYYLVTINSDMGRLKKFLTPYEYFVVFEVHGAQVRQITKRAAQPDLAS